MGLQTFGGLSLCLGLKVLVFVLSAVYPGITWVGLKGFTAFKKVFVLSADPTNNGPSSRRPVGLQYYYNVL